MSRLSRLIDNTGKRAGYFYQELRESLSRAARKAAMKGFPRGSRAARRAYHKLQMHQADDQIRELFGSNISGRQKRKLRRKLMGRPSVGGSR